MRYGHRPRDGHADGAILSLKARRCLWSRVCRHACLWSCRFRSRSQSNSQITARVTRRERRQPSLRPLSRSLHGSSRGSIIRRLTHRVKIANPFSSDYPDTSPSFRSLRAASSRCCFVDASDSRQEMVNQTSCEFQSLRSMPHRRWSRRRSIMAVDSSKPSSQG